MRTLLSVIAVALCLLGLFSCSSNKVTKADIAAFKLRDLTRYGQPHIVKVSQDEVQNLQRAEWKSGRMATLDPKHRFQGRQSFRAPVDFVPPSLPNGSVAFDGSILPPKEGGSPAVINNYGALPGKSYRAPSYPAAAPQNFSIE